MKKFIIGYILVLGLSLTVSGPATILAHPGDDLEPKPMIAPPDAVNM
ncbi:MAG TPA: hypothetical protein VK057_10535 [Bacillota bacterium]|nr:hypothetical protein [Bacillota bacterium]